MAGSWCHTTIEVLQMKIKNDSFFLQKTTKVLYSLQAIETLK